MIKKNQHLEGKHTEMILLKLARINILGLEYNSDSQEIIFREITAAEHVATCTK